MLVTRLAPAKLNLSLEVVGRRADGYHLLDSLVAFAAYGDTIEARPDRDLTLRITGPFADEFEAPSEDNLVMRAARLLAREAGVTAGAAITLTKRLPIASGIGGGSSDAAATLLALSELWGSSLGGAALSSLGLQLGADVPVCLFGRPARLQGVGDRITPVPPLPPAPVVLVNPRKKLGTREVFARRSGPFSPETGPYPLFTAGPADAPALARLLAGSRNDLLEPALALLPEIGGVLDRLSREPACLLARMSGSGATCFALFPDEESASRASLRIQEERPDWWTVATRLLPGGFLEAPTPGQ